MTRFFLFVLVGAALGYLLSALGARPSSRNAVLVWMVVRLVLFVGVVAFVSRQFGPMAGVVALVAAILTRGMTMRSRRVELDR